MASAKKEKNIQEISVQNEIEKESGVAETIESLKKYERRPGKAEKFLNDVGSCDEDDIKTAYSYLVFFNCLDKGEFNKFMNNWVLVYNQEVIEYGQEYTKEEQWAKLEEKPGAIYLPADLSKHPKVRPARAVHARHANNRNKYTV
ncbi:ATP dependent DNA helicase [Gigaspora margarita]|uniref:ATP dependent DNA helicase n=1 Tax=Gigaspora margarita TaxID=4874 RepID=A0A8H4AL74_GIGMA|nr:ATP dependent DNA helicase [Gigaspora margarita]